METRLLGLLDRVLYLLRHKLIIHKQYKLGEFPEELHKVINKHIFSKTKTFTYIFLVVLLLTPVLTTLTTQTVKAAKSEYTYNLTQSWGTASEERVYDLNEDSNGNIYIAGIFNGTTDLDPGVGVNSFTSVGSYDPYISKFDSSGNYVWSRVFGGSTGLDRAWLIDIDNQDNLYVSSGFLNTADFDPGVGTDNRTSAGSDDIAITKFDTDGNRDWTKTYGGTGFDFSGNIVFDDDGSFYLHGGYNTTVDFDPGSGTVNRTTNGARDLYLSKFDADGNFVSVKTWGGTSTEGTNWLAKDSQGNLYLTTYFTSTSIDFNPDGGVDTHTSDGSGDGAITKFNADESYAWTKTIGGDSYEDTYPGLAIDSQDNVYYAGEYDSTSIDLNPNGGVDTHTSSGFGSGFVTKLDPDGNYEWSRTFTGNDYYEILQIDVDDFDNLYLGAYFNGTADFDLGAATDEHTSAGGYDGGVIKLNSNGEYLSSSTVGGNGSDYSEIHVIDDKLYTFGNYFSTGIDLDPFGGEDIRSTAGGGDAYFSIYDLTYTQHIANIPSGLSATTVSGDSIDNESTDDGIVRGDTETVRLSTDSGIPLADVSTDFDADLDWSSVTADSSSSSFKSYVHNLTDAPGTASSFTLYVPYNPNDDTVAICPGTDSLTDVSLTCDNMETYTEADPEASIVTIDSSEYWKITGLTGTGGISTTQTELDGTASQTLADTGLNQNTFLLLAVVLLTIGSTIIYRKRRA